MTSEEFVNELRALVGADADHLKETGESDIVKRPLDYMGHIIKLLKTVDENNQ